MDLDADLNLDLFCQGLLHTLCTLFHAHGIPLEAVIIGYVKKKADMC